jgi:hypothetical protein
MFEPKIEISSEQIFVGEIFSNETPGKTETDEIKWLFFGHQGHFYGKCNFFIHTRIGKYRISTVGDYYDSNGNREILSARKPNAYYETMVFEVSGFGFHGEGEVIDWEEELYSALSDVCTKAHSTHFLVCNIFSEKSKRGK